MKKNLLFNALYFFILLGSISIKAQDITFVPQDTLLVDTLGAEIIFTINVTNISTQAQTVYVLRTLNDLPTNWQSSFCFALCFPPFIDSIATTIDFGSSPLTPGETREVSLHVLSQNNPGTAYLQVRAGTFRSPGITYTVNLTAIVNPTSVNDGDPALNDFSLSQNYPNPFNPSTRIQYQVSSNSYVSLKIYDVLGNEVATLVNEYKPAGSYEVDFDGNNLPSGIYFYGLTTQDFSQTRKMILEK